MNIRQMLLAGVTVMLLATGNAWAQKASEKNYGASGWFSRSTLINSWQRKIHVWRNNKWHVGTHKLDQSSGSTPTGGVTRGVAPEIDAASGTSAIALLTGVLLLVGERSRSRRS